MVAGAGGHTEIPDLADELSFEIDDLLPLVDAATLLQLLTVQDTAISMTAAGRRWHDADIRDSKKIFAALTVEHAPLIRMMAGAVDRSDRGRIRDDFFRDLLRRRYSADDAQRQLDIAIDWGRYGELFDYDTQTGDLVRPVP